MGDDAPSMQDEIDQTMAAVTPEPLVTMIEAMVADLRDRGVVPGLEPGEPAPDFDLSDASGDRVRLHDRLAAGPVVLTFYRGAWCPACNIELRALQAALPELRARGASLVAVSPQSPDDSLGFAELERFIDQQVKHYSSGMFVRLGFAVATSVRSTR